MKVGAGVEARADLTLGYWLKIEPAIGFARGFNEGGEAQVYFHNCRAMKESRAASHGASTGTE